MFKKALGIGALAALASASFASPALAYGGQGGAGTVVLNPGGARLADGSDGIVMIFNGLSGGAGVAVDDGNDDTADMSVTQDGSDQVYFAQVPQWCCNTGVGPVLLIGSTAVGEASALSNNGAGQSWDSITVVSTTGADETIANGSLDAISSTDTGDATAEILYSVVVGGRTYTVTREISYTYPNSYYDEVWTVTIPSGNTDTVKFYLGGDAAPGGTDSGNSEVVEISGKTHLREKNVVSGQYISYQQTAAGSAWTHYFVGNYNDPQSTIIAGEDLDDSVSTEDEHDAGIYVQWTFGSTPGDYSKEMRTKIGFNNEFELAETGVDASGIALAGLALAGLGAAVAIRRRARA